jgi:hypothetical protein
MRQFSSAKDKGVTLGDLTQRLKPSAFSERVAPPWARRGFRPAMGVVKRQKGFLAKFSFLMRR